MSNWTDYSMSWDPARYDNITDVRLPFDRLWKPDVLLYNSVDEDFDSTFKTNLILYSDGTVIWQPPGIFELSCSIDITWFPFDQQFCYFKFGSWSYDGTRLDLRRNEDGFDMSEYLPSGEWSIDRVEVIRYERLYDCCPDNPFPDLKFWMIMRRRTLYFGVNFIVPCILITMMCILGFLLPPNSGEKISLQITVLLAVVVFLNMVMNMSPTTSEAVPLLGIFFSTCMVVVAAAVLTTVMVLNFHYTSPEFDEMGYTTRCILLHWLPWLLYMERPGEHLTYRSLPNPFRNPNAKPAKIAEYWRKLRRFFVGSCRKPVEATGEDPEDACCDDSNDGPAEGEPSEADSDSTNSEPTDGLGGVGLEEKDIDERINECYRTMSSRAELHELDWNVQSRLFMLYRIYKELRAVTNRLRATDGVKAKRNEWIYAAIVIDRLCLWLIGVFIVFSTCFIMFQAPYLTVTVPDGA